MTQNSSKKWSSQKFSVTLLASASVIALGLLSATYAQAGESGADAAQDATATSSAPSAEQETVVVVTGIRGSLQRSMNMKRNASGVVDSITSEDIGKYPDSNIAESAQRIPGVAIDRSNGQGKSITVRGFGPGFNLTTLNGRVMPTANIDLIGSNNLFGGGGSRSFDFSSIAPDGVSGFDVYKTGRASIASGGIGATLNLRTLQPIGKAGTSGSFSIKALHGDNMVDGKDFTPDISGSFVSTNDAKTFGVSLFGEYSEKDVATRESAPNGWNLDTYDQFFSPSNGRLKFAPGGALQTQITNMPTPGSLISYPNDVLFAFGQSHYKQTNVGAMVQWRPVENWLFTADALYVESEQSEERAEMNNWFARPFDQITFEKGASGIYNAVYLHETNAGGGKDIGWQQDLYGQKNTLKSVGLNAKWDINEHSALAIDLHSAEAEVSPNNRNGTSTVALGIGAPVIDSHSADFTGKFPVETDVYNDSVRGNNNGKLDLGDLSSTIARQGTNSQRDKVDEIKADYSYFDGDSRFDAGFDWTRNDMSTATGQSLQTLGDWGLTKVGDVAAYANGLVQPYDLNSLFRDSDTGTTGVAFRGNALDIYEALVKSPLYNTTIPNVALTTNSIRETVTGAYMQVSTKFDFLGRPADVVAGIRYESTEVLSSATQTVPTSIDWTSGNNFVVMYGTGIQTVSAKAKYNNWLPSLDFAWHPTETIVARASFSQTLARPAFSNMFATTSISSQPRETYFGTGPRATSGNPGLLPLESSNIDFSVEWYYGKANYVSLGFYNKDINNFVGTGVIKSPQFGLRDPSSGATGTRSGTAVAALNSISQGVTSNNLFTMAALLQKYNGDVNAAKAEYQANLSGGELPASYLAQIAAGYDLVGDSTDPLYSFDTTVPVNNRSANIHGIELAAQHFFGNTGFGLAGSLTVVNGDIGFDDSAAPGTQQFPLLGLSDTYNVTAIYDKGKLSGRLSYNWRDKYISSSNVGAAGDPNYVAPFGVVDAAVNYQLTPSVQITFRGQNLGHEGIRVYGRDTTSLYFAQELDTRYEVGVRYKF